MHRRALFVLFFVVVAATGTLVTAITVSAPAQGALFCAGQETDTRTCHNSREIRSSGEIDKRQAMPR